MTRLAIDEDLRGEGAFTIKRVGNQEYLYKVSTVKGKQKWEIMGNVKDLDPKEPNLVKARTIQILKEVKPILEKYLSGKLDKEKAKSELSKLLDR